MKSWHLALTLVLGCFAILPPASAELVATPLTGDSRLVQFSYDEDNTFLVLAKPKAVTHIQFAADEVLQSVAAGDTAQWELTPTKNKKNLFIKPKYEDMETSMSVITDKRTYQFVLKSTGSGKKWYQRVSWVYASNMVLESDAQIEQISGLDNKPSRSSRSSMEMGGDGEFPVGARDGVKIPGLKPEDLRFNYTISGNAPFKPVIVFDNGKFTYFKMPKDMQEMPALFAEVEGKSFALVNYHIEDEYMVAQRLIDAAVLRLGKSEVRIVQNKASPGFFGTVFGSGEGR